ncbi:Positive regulator of purine utilization [Hypsizygus marmoreus]|uniref:Positive regulator of purine utilization n=1 Tax=Hypsizygus marmoreus TaxID=39966 RepID=A0A369KD56_HYPMA|nr:Positive regulator of purine utilization [Hypsizygus marmoreus]
MFYGQVLGRNMGIDDSALNSLIPGPLAKVHEDLMIGVALQRIPNGLLAQACDSDSREWDPLISTDQIPYSLPHNREATHLILTCYFTRCHPSCPVVERDDFYRVFHAFCERREPFDPNILCVIHMVLALGTMVLAHDYSVSGTPFVSGWPHHKEFFTRASYLNVHMHSAISSLRALLLIHMYLSLESPERNLWRLVGNITRLAIELNLHRNPQTLKKSNSLSFTAAESTIRIQLWSIILVLDRGTSLVLGRPFGISSDFNTPPPPVTPLSGHSSHFYSSHFISDIQAGIISIYAMNPQDSAALTRQSVLLLKAIDDFRHGMSNEYRLYFSGEIPSRMTEGEILTVLKLSFSRILLSRILFFSDYLPQKIQRSALEDGMITAYNMIQLERLLLSLPGMGVRSSHIQIYTAVMMLLVGFGSFQQKGPLDSPTVFSVICLAYELIPQTSLQQSAETGQAFFTQLVQDASGVDIDKVVALSGPYVLRHQPGWLCEGNGE